MLSSGDTILISRFGPLLLGRWTRPVDRSSRTMCDVLPSGVNARVLPEPSVRVLLLKKEGTAIGAAEEDVHHAHASLVDVMWNARDDNLSHVTGSSLVS